MTLAGILLCAGTSRRFGVEDKLLADLNDRPLVTHAAKVLQAFRPDILIGVCQSDAVAGLLTGYDVIRPAEEDLSQSDSLRAAVAHAKTRGATRVLIALGDMPFITADLLHAVTSKCTDTRPAAATDGTRPMPPACFPQACFSDLMDVRGDRGAGRLLKDLPQSALVTTSQKTLQDVDTPDALSRLQN